MDPRLAQEAVSAQVTRQIFETPYELCEDVRKVRECLFQDLLRAESSGTRPVYSAAVRDGIHFSDGTPLTAAHVAQALSESEDLKQQAQVSLQGDRLHFTLLRPNCRFETTLTQTYCSVGLEKEGKFLGTGPYQAQPSARPDAVHLVRNPYYRGEVGFDEILFKVYPPAPDGGHGPLLAAIDNGEVDFTNAVTRKDAELIKKARTRIEPGTSTAILYFNTERLTDPTLRRALALAIDRQDIAGLFYRNPLTFAANSLLPRVMGGRDDGLAHDMQGALVMLAHAGTQKPERMRLLLTWAPRPYLPNPRAAGERIARFFERLGIRVDLIQPADSREYYQRVEKGDYEMELSGWVADTPDPAEFLEANLSSERIPGPGRAPVAATNESRWRNAAADDAIACYRSDPSEVCKNRILDLVSQEVPLFPLMYGPSIIVHSRRIASFKPPVFGWPSLANLKPV